MFYGRHPDLGAAVGGSRDVIEHGIVGLGRAGRPNDIERIATKGACQFLSSLLQGGVRARSEAMWAGGIADVEFVGFEPSLARFRKQWGGSVMVEVQHAERSWAFPRSVRIRITITITITIRITIRITKYQSEREKIQAGSFSCFLIALLVSEYILGAQECDDHAETVQPYRR